LLKAKTLLWVSYYLPGKKGHRNMFLFIYKNFGKIKSGSYIMKIGQGESDFGQGPDFSS
jgi:hypothetical protein